MTQTILVPLDGTAVAARAIPYAATIARATGASVLLLHTVPAPAARRSPYHQISAEPASAMLEAHAAALRQQGVAVQTLVLTGEAVRWIVDVARVRDVALIVMARRSHGLFGTITEAVLARTSAPILLVSDDTTLDGPERLLASPRLLVPLDGSAAAEEALALASNLASRLGGALVLLQATAPDAAATADLVAADGAPAPSAYLRDLVVRGAAMGTTVHFDVRPGEPAAAIEASGDEHDAALIVMTTHCQGGPHRYALGRVSRAVLHKSRLPLLLIRPQTLGTPECLTGAWSGVAATMPGHASAGW
ncbi:MAG: universal stress protein [Thermomicrobiales bacterium]